MKMPRDDFGGRSSDRPRGDSPGFVAACVSGLGFNLVSLYVGNPYVVSVLCLVLALVAMVKWRTDRLALIVLAATVASNPVNINATIACNLIIGMVYLLLHLRELANVPRWLYAAGGVTLLSVVVSVAFWTTGLALEGLFTQGANIANYLIGPLVVMPALFASVRSYDDSELLLKAMLFGLIVPTTLTLALARAIGVPVAGEMMGQIEYELYSVYRLGSVDVTLTRTQAGFVVAALANASLAIVICDIRRRLRWLAAVTAAVLAVLLVVTGSVGSTIAALCGLMVTLFAARRHVKRKVYLMAAAVAVPVVIAGWMMLPEGVRQYAGHRYEARFSADGIGVSDRWQIWGRSLEYLYDNATGVGWSLFVEPIGTYPHNDYLAYAIGFGVMCGLAYWYVTTRAWVGLVLAHTRGADGARTALRLASLGAATVLLVNSMSDHLTANRWYFNVIWSVVWLGYFASMSVKAGSRQVRAA